MKNKLIPFLLVLLTFWSCSLIFGQVDKKSKDDIQWMTWSEVEDALKKEKRKVFVDIYTTWCGPCKEMDRTTFKDKEIIKYINDNFYAVKFKQFSAQIKIFPGHFFFKHRSALPNLFLYSTLNPFG